MTAVLGGVLLLLPLHAFISTWGGTAIGPLEVWKGWKEIALLLVVPTVGGYCFLRPDIAKRIWARWINKYIVLYLLLNVAFAITSEASASAVYAGLLMNLRFFAMFVLAQVVLASGHPWVELAKKYLTPWLLWTMIGLAVLAILQVTLLPHDFLAQFGYNKDVTIAPYILVDQNPDAVRAFATLRGPNELGSYLLLPLALAVWLLAQNRRNWLAWAAFAGGLVALGLSGSRSAWLGAATMFVILAALMVPRHRVMFWVKRLAPPLVLVVAGVLALAATVPTVRLLVFHSSPDDSSLVEGSTADHWQATSDGIKDVIANPFGHGVGAAGPASYYNTGHPARIAENYFVQVAQEIGVLGLILFIIICALLVQQLWKRRQQQWPALLLAGFAGLTVINLFLHGWVDDPTSMTWWAVAGLWAFKTGGKMGPIQL